MALACAAPGAAPRSSTGPFNDTMLKVNSVGPFVPHSQDDLWTACGAYVDDADGDGILSSVCSENELSSMVSMVTSSVQQQQQRQQPESHHHQRRHSEVLASSGIHCNVPLPVSSFDSGSTGSHGSCTPPFSAGSPVTVLPPLPFSYPDDGKDQEGYVQFVNGFWPHQDHTYECGTVGENNFSSLLNELPLRPFNDVVDGGDVDLHGARANDCRLVEISQQQQQSSVSSHVSCQTSDNVSGSSPSGSSRTGIVDSSISQEFIVRRDCGSEQQQLSAGSHSASQAISCSTNCSPSSPASTPGAAKPTTVPGQIESEVSPAAGHVRLSWTDHYWPTTSNGTPLVDTMFHSSSGAIPSTHQHLQLPQQIVNVFQRSANSQVPLTFHDADYVATCNQYRKTQLQDTAAPAVGGIDSCHGLKRPFSTMQSASSNTATSTSTVGTTSSIATSASQSLLKHTTTSTSNHLQDAAALSALLYKSNHNNARSLSSAQSAQATHPAAANVGAPTAAAASSEDSQLMPPPKLRRRHGTATDPQSIAARTRRERFSDRIRLLQSLVPNGERLDTVSMLGHTLEYVRFLQHKVWQLYNGGDDASTSETDSESREKWKEFMDTTQVPIS